MLVATSEYQASVTKYCMKICFQVQNSIEGCHIKIWQLIFLLQHGPL